MSLRNTSVNEPVKITCNIVSGATLVSNAEHKTPSDEKNVSVEAVLIFCLLLWAIITAGKRLADRAFIGKGFFK